MGTELLERGNMLNALGLIKQAILSRLDPWRYPPYNITRGDPRVRSFALTFDADCGPRSIFEGIAARSILESLRSGNLRCTFFLTGRFIESYPELVGSIVEAGHEVGNHTYTHPHLYSLDIPSFKREVSRTEEEFERVTGRRLAPYWRAPYGEYHRRLWKTAVGCGYTHIGWTHGRTVSQGFDSFDWVDDPQSNRYFPPRQILERMLSSDKKNGAIALFHLGSRKPDPVYTILPKLIDGLASMQYRIVRISELQASSTFSGHSGVAGPSLFQRQGRT
jgi:peptidoglycan/xylan/chitin deacetylase (PgdA/CDA1 family)